MQLRLLDDKEYVELPCPSCLCDSNFIKNEEFTLRQNHWITQCENCGFVKEVSFEDNVDPAYCIIPKKIVRRETNES